MRMSQGVEWALHTCLNLSWLDAPVPTSTLAAFYELPPAYLNKQLQALTTKRDTGGAVLNDAARGTLDKEIDKLQRDIQYAQQSAEADMQDLTNELQGEFQKRLIPIIEEVAKEKGLHAVFSIADSGAAYVHAGLNISEEVVKRLDAAAAKK